MHKIVLEPFVRIVIFLAFLFAAVHAGTITIAVAANVSYAMPELTQAFETTHPDTSVRVVLGSSGKLTAQIQNGAPYGLFMAANMSYPEALHRAGVALATPAVYAQGTLAYLSIRPLQTRRGIAMLEGTAFDTIAIANPKTAPYGIAAVEALKNAHLYGKVKRRLVYAESISQAVAYALGAADIGFVAASSLYSPKMVAWKKGVHWDLVDPALYTPIRQGIVLLKYGAKDPGYRAFYDFMLGTTAKTILARYGYIIA